MGPRDRVVRCPVVFEPVLLVPNGADVDHRHIRPDRGGAAGSAHGRQDHRQGVLQGKAVGVHAQPWAFQREGACADHHLRQLRRRYRLRYPYRHRCQGFL